MVWLKELSCGSSSCVGVATGVPSAAWEESTTSFVGRTPPPPEEASWCSSLRRTSVCRRFVEGTDNCWTCASWCLLLLWLDGSCGYSNEDCVACRCKEMRVRIENSNKKTNTFVKNDNDDDDDDLPAPPHRHGSQQSGEWCRVWC